MRLSAAFAPTLRQAPSDIESTGHRLLVQAGFLRRAGAGAWVWLPLGTKVIHKVCAAVREEMLRAGFQEVLLPLLQPAGIWERSGRLSELGADLLRLKDRQGREFILGPGHEELLADVFGGEIRSYRQLPQRFLHISTGFGPGDGSRPAGGRRESLVSWAYSFDRDRAGQARAHQLMADACLAVFRRLGLEAGTALAAAGAAPAETGPGPAGAATGARGPACELVAISTAGNVGLIGCPACGYLATPEAAAAVAGAPAGGGAPEPESPVLAGGPAGGTGRGPVRVSTPGLHTVEAVASFLGIGPEALIKTMIVLLPDGTPAVGLVRGDHELSPAKLAAALGAGSVQLADPATVERLSAAPVGFAGPVGLGDIVTVADHAVTQMATAVTGACEADAHLTGVRPGIDFSFAFAADIREVAAGDACPACGAAPLQARRGTAVGRAEALGTGCGERLGLQFAAEDGALQPVFIGRCAVDIAGTVVAVAEGHHDARGLSWPLPAAPGDVLVLPVNDRDEAQLEAAARIYDELLLRGVDAVLDDRPERAGVKFNDADLQGWPLRVTVGPRGLAQGAVELRERAGGAERRVPLESVAAEVAALVGKRLREYRGE